MNFNKAFLLGRLTNDPDNRVLPSGQPVTSFSIATNRVWTNQSGQKQEDVQFHNIVMFGRLAEIGSKYLSRGGLVLIEGRIQNRSWEGKDGQKRYRTEVIAENLQLGPRSGGSGDAREAATKGGESRSPSKSDQEDIPVIESDAPVNNDDDIPF